MRHHFVNPPWDFVEDTRGIPLGNFLLEAIQKLRLSCTLCFHLRRLFAHRFNVGLSVP